MNREDIIRMAKECGAYPAANVDGALLFWSESQVERFATIIAAAEREKLAAWMIKHSYATGHGDSTEDLLKELEWQIAENQPQEFVLTQTNVGIGERGMQAYEEAKKRGWVGISDEMEMPKQEPK